MSLQQKYNKEIVPALKEELALKNVMELPRLKKIVVNVGVGQAVSNPKSLETVYDELAAIAGQRAVKTYARKSIAAFKLREGMPIGCMVTLRRQRMFSFLDRLINIILPRVRDFRGLNPRAFDGYGNYNLSLKEQIVFPEIDVDKVDSYHGMNITVVSTAKKDEEARALLRHLGMPFVREN